MSRNNKEKDLKQAEIEKERNIGGLEAEYQKCQARMDDKEAKVR